MSAIVVSYNSAETLVPCLEALRGSSYPNLEIIVVDNASRDASADLVRRRFPSARLIVNERNRGFAGAVLDGTRVARGDIVALVNPDALVAADWLAALIAALESDPRIAIAGSKILEPDGRTLQHAGGIVHPNALTDHRGRGEIDRGQYDRMEDVAYVTGAAIVVRRSLVGVDFLDPGYFPAYFEEAELCVRARRAGFRVVYVPRAVVIHKEAASTGKFSHDFLYCYHRNRLRFVLKTSSVADFFTGFLPAELSWIRRACPQLRSLCKSYLVNLLRLPSTLIARLRSRPFVV